MYVELLKELYCQERKKLEEMWIYKQEAEFKLLKAKEDIVNQAKGHLSISELLGRADIPEEVKDNLLRNKDKEDKIMERLDAMVGDELTEIDRAKEAQLRNADYAPAEYAQYLYQLEKVFAIEAELENNRLFPEAVYEERKNREAEKGKEEVEK
jgi:hypothetical protein